MLAKSPHSPLVWLEQNYGSLKIGPLEWFELGVGWLPSSTGDRLYDQAYFDEFRRRAATDLGRDIMRARVGFVARHYSGILCDVGIGSGAFIEARNRRRRNNTFGWDVNPLALKWLDDRGILVDPNLVELPAISLWDVLEHIPDFSRLLGNAGTWIFLSLPIFRSVEHVLASKHFKPNEHVWYFTTDGLIEMMKHYGFSLIERNSMETELGREDVESFAFRHQ